MTAHSLLIRSMPCICCQMLEVDQPFPTEAHHLLHAGKRIGDSAQIPCCKWHHRGLLLPGMSVKGMTEDYGPSLANGSKPFHAVFGSDSELLAKIA